MKKILLIIAVILSGGSLVAQSTGINFENGSYTEALGKAKLAGKYLFIDCYTTWCVPCKMLEKEIFTNEKVADYFNTKFINFRLDVEKGEGIELRKRFGVQPVPTLLFINADGEVEHKFIGSSPADEFMLLASQVFTKENRYGILQRKFKAGDRSADFMAEYIHELMDQSEHAKAKELLDGVLKTSSPEQICTKKFWPILTGNFIAERGSDVYSILIRNSDLLRQNVGKEEYDRKLSQIFIRYANIWVFSGEKEYNKPVFDEMRSDIKNLALPDQGEVLLIMNIAESRVKKDYDTFLSLFEKSSGSIKAENLYSLFIDSGFMAQQGTAAQCKRFQDVIEKFLIAAKNENYSKRLDSVVKQLKNKTENK